VYEVRRSPACEQRQGRMWRCSGSLLSFKHCAAIQSDAHSYTGFFACFNTSLVCVSHREFAMHRMCSRHFRCVALSHGQMVPAVSLFSEVQRELATHSRKIGEWPQVAESVEAHSFKGQSLLTPQQLRDQLKTIREQKAVCIMVMDILDATGSFLNNCRDLIGGNPAIIVATKIDLLPKGTDLEQTQQWLQRFVEYKGFTCLAAHVVSNKTGACSPHQSARAIRACATPRQILDPQCCSNVCH
jgi:hypothetical protein